MSQHLDPVILQKLQAFARRRRSLIILRGVFAAVAMLVATMLAVAAVDFLIPLLADWVRWVLSAVAYTAVVGIVWRQCLQQLLHAPDERQIARLVEHAEPKLQEDLLSAVELGRTQGDVFDSDQFRGLLQTDISARMQGLEMASLLPMALIKRYIGVTAAILAVVLVLILASQHRFKTLFLRALMPGANLETVSSTQFFIVKPKPGDQTVAQGDAVELVIELRGETAKTVKLETQGTMRGRRVAEMKPLGKNQFSAAIQVGRENVRYRMQAGDGRTRLFELILLPCLPLVQLHHLHHLRQPHVIARMGAQFDQLIRARDQVLLRFQQLDRGQKIGRRTQLIFRAELVLKRGLCRHQMHAIAARTRHRHARHHLPVRQRLQRNLDLLFAQIHPQ